MHEPLGGQGAIACVCAAPLPACDEGRTRIGWRFARACRLMARAGAARPARAQRLRRRAMHLLRLDRRAMSRIAKTQPPGSTCAREILRRLDVLEHP